MDAKKEIEKLREEIEYHNRLYYVNDAPVISDYDYDMLMVRLIKLEEEHPELVTPTSPTQRVGGKALSQFAPVHHRVPLESLSDVFSFDELKACGSMAAAREKGLVRSEGKDYVMHDGDVTLFRFNV